MGKQKENAIKTIYSAYGVLLLDYASIPFDRMSRDDEDFRFLFDYKEKLDELGTLLSGFINKCHGSRFNVRESCTEYVKLKQAIKEIDKMDYEENVLKKYGLVQ